MEPLVILLARYVDIKTWRCQKTSSSTIYRKTEKIVNEFSC